MRNILLILRFVGTPFCGYQVQKNGITIMEVVHNAIQSVTGVRSQVKGCSRTDSGVHANMYCLNFWTQSNISCEKLLLALNMHLPQEVAVTYCREMPEDFHARYSCTGKEYLYRIQNASWRDPFLSGLAYSYHPRLDTEKLNRAGKHFLGTHDFASFCAAGGKKMDTVRTITDFSVERTGELVEIRVAGDGFLFHMVRIMVGTLLWVNQGRILPDDILGIIEAKDRRRAGITAPPEGLYLNRVFYPKGLF